MYIFLIYIYCCICYFVIVSSDRKNKSSITTEQNTHLDFVPGLNLTNKNPITVGREEHET